MIARFQQWLPDLLNLCKVAGDLIVEHYHSDQASQYQLKGDQSPLTVADLGSHKILAAGLRKLSPEYQVLSEESPVQSLAERSKWDAYWLVDPLDGTREFLNRTGDFSINVAFINENIPQLGILYLPLECAAYVGIPGVSADYYYRQANGLWDNRALRVSASQNDLPSRVVVGRGRMGKKVKSCIDGLRQEGGKLSVSQVGGAIKFCDLVTGKADMYPRFSNCCEWDVAAGQAILEAAGGVLLNHYGEVPRYNCSETLLADNFFAFADASYPLWQHLPWRGNPQGIVRE